jgi:hypothetical protein
MTRQQMMESETDTAVAVPVTVQLASPIHSPTSEIRPTTPQNVPRPTTPVSVTTTPPNNNPRPTTPVNTSKLQVTPALPPKEPEVIKPENVVQGKKNFLGIFS